MPQRSRWIPLLFCAFLGMTGAARAQEKSLSDLSFLSGCWRGELSGQDGTIEERYSVPAGGLILGTSQTIAGGRTAFYEFIKIEHSAEGIVMTPAPRGKLSVPFKMVRLDGRKAVFENLAHDFPKRITYQLREDGALAASIHGEKPEQTQEFVMPPVPCGREARQPGSP